MRRDSTAEKWSGIGLAALLLFATARCGRADGPAKKSAARPNIVLILADDIGFSDLGCQGGEIRTPNLDALAANGLRFTQFYNTGRCCPTRASLLTGLYPHQAGVGHMMEDHGPAFPGYRGDLNDHCVTLAQALRPAGYDANMVGKWHVTRHIRENESNRNWPLQRGFSRYYGIVNGAANYFDPFLLVRDNRPISPFADPEYKPQTYYLTDALADQAVRFVGEHSRDREAKPFFLYVAFTAAHWPMQALPEDIARYKGRYDAGFEGIRRARLEKSIRLGMVDPKQGFAPTAEDWEGVPDKKREAAYMEVYAAMVDRMDQGVGKLVAELKRTEQFDRTLIFFLQDNGGCAEPEGRALKQDRIDGPRGDRPTLPTIAAETLTTAMIATGTRDGYPVRQGPNVEPGPADTFVGYGRGWANVSNTPFREYKHWVHEGGISSPLIVHWPAGIAARGELRKQPGHLIDIMATCLDVAKATYPTEIDGNSITPIEGKSLVPAFDGKPIDRDALYWEHEGNRAIRVGDWKLVAKGPKGDWELYDIAADRVELRDLSAKHPEKVRELREKWETWADRAHVLPWISKTPYGTTAARVDPKESPR